MRCDQYIGLNDWARRLVTRKEKVREFGVQVFAGGKRKKFSRWRRIPVARKESAGVIRGAYDSRFPLHRYTLPGGVVLVEYVQASPWSGGPCYFVALKDQQGRPVPESLWTDAEINGA